MKKIFGVVLAAAMVASCTNNKAKFTISGESDKFAGKYAYLQVEEENALKTIDSVAVEGNAFVLEGVAEQPYVAYFVIKEAGAERPEMFTQLYVEPAEIAIRAIEGEKRTTLAAIGGNLNGIVDQINSYLSELEELMEQRKAFEYSSEVEQIKPIEGLGSHALAVSPIITNGDISGAVAIVSENESEKCSALQAMLCKAGAMFLGKQIES